MRRFVCVFLPFWETERLAAAQPEKVPDIQPMAIIASGSGGWRIAAVNAQARALGVMAGELLADVRARVGDLEVREAEPETDRAALVRLAQWCMAFTPHVSPWPDEDGSSHGLTLDIAGCAHLFSGEAGLAARLSDALSRFGLSARLAIAGTIGAAHALARFGQGAIAIVESGTERAAIAALPIAALRLASETSAGLQRLGLRRIGDIAHLPRAPLAKRFGRQLLLRLDQAFGHTSESFSPLAPPARHRAHAVLAEPIASQDHVLALTGRLMGDLVPALARDDKGARALRLLLYRVDGKRVCLEIGLARPSRDAPHAVKLFSLRLEALADDFDAGFGFEAASLEAVAVEPLLPTQEGFTAQPVDESLSVLVDRLGSRLGVANVLRLHPQDTHIPERAVVLLPASEGAPLWSGEAPLVRPLLMLPSAEPADVLALLPDGPPGQFRWRGVRYSVAHAEGPERIRAEWWRGGKGTRDYYIAEDEEGRRFWLYREGAYGGEVPPRWYVHGVFA